MYKYEITEFTSTYHLIDSIALIDSVITNADRETIRLYFRTYTPPEEEDPDTPVESDDPDATETSDDTDNA